LIGEAFDSFDDICGAVVNIRAKGDKIGKQNIPEFLINASCLLDFCFSYLDQQQQQQRRSHGDRKKAEGRTQPARPSQNSISNAFRLDGEEFVQRQVAL
jgi:hypothetical protein